MAKIVRKSAGQKKAEATVDGFRKRLGPFVVAAETTRKPMLFTDAEAPGHPIIFVNDSFLAVSRYGREELMGQRFDFLSVQGGNHVSEVEAAFADDAGVTEIYCRRKGGEVFRTALFVSPVQDEAGHVIEHFISLVDLSQHEREEERLRFLLDELNHRTLNTLASVQSIVLQTLRGHADGALVEKLERRILALSKAHGLLGRDNWDAVPVRDVLDEILRPIRWNGHVGPRISIDSPDVRLSPRAVPAVALILHEMAANAKDHGALSNGSDGQVDIDWTMMPTPNGERMRLRWRESGGPHVEPPTKRGFGSRLLEGQLAGEFNGEVSLDYAPGGMVCTIVMPVSKAQEATQYA